MSEKIVKQQMKSMGMDLADFGTPTYYRSIAKAGRSKNPYQKTAAKQLSNASKQIEIIRDRNAQSFTRKRTVPARNLSRDSIRQGLKTQANRRNIMAAGSPLLPLKYAARLGEATARGTYITAKNPGESLVSNGKFLASIPWGLVKIAYEAPQGKIPPKALLKGMYDDTMEKWRPVFGERADWKEFEKQVKKRGLADYGLDVAAVAAPAGKLAGIGARAGKFGAKAQAFVNTPRPTLRFGEGRNATKRQRDETEKAAPNVFRVAVQRAKDKRTQKQYEKRNRESHVTDHNIPTVRPQKPAYTTEPPSSGRFLAARKGVVEERTLPERGEIVPSERRQRKLRAKAAAREKSALYPRLYAAQAAEIGPLSKEIYSLRDGLTKEEQAGLAYMQRGLINPDDKFMSVMHLLGLKQNHRIKKGIPARPGEKTEFALLRDMRDAPEKYFTPRAFAVAEKMKKLERETVANDPGVPRRKAMARRSAEQRILLDVEDTRMVENYDAGATAQKILTREIDKAGDAFAVRQKILKGHFDSVASAKAVLRKRGQKVTPKSIRRVENEILGITPKWRKVPFDPVKSAKVILRKRGRKVTKRNVNDLANKLQRLRHPEAPTPYTDRALTALTKKFEKGAKTKRERTEPELVRAARDARADRGLPVPGYFPSQRFDEPSFASWAGGGSRMSHSPKKHTGELFRSGREATDIRIFLEGIARSIKRREQWPAVQRLIDQFVDTSVSGTQGKSVFELMQSIEMRGHNIGQYDIWMPGKARNIVRSHGELDLPEDAGIGGEIAQSVDTAIAQSLIPADRLSQMIAANPKEFESVKAFAIPKGVLGELTPVVGRSDAAVKAGRGYMIAKGKLSRLLFFANVPWAFANLGSNVLTSTVTGTKPWHSLKLAPGVETGNEWLNKLHPEIEREISARVAVSMMSDAIMKPRMGAYGDGPIMAGLRKMGDIIHHPYFGIERPVERSVDFWMDMERKYAEKPFRMGALYSAMKKDRAFKDLSANVRKSNVELQRLSDISKLPMSEQKAAWEANRIHFERYAEHVADAVGDYTTLGKAERGVAGTAMFYTWMRFSLKFVFWTLPVNHPMLSYIASQVQKLDMKELEQIYGDDLPYEFNGLSTLPGFLGGGPVNLRKFSPAGNAISDMVFSGDFSRIGSVFNPAAAALLTALTGRDFSKRLDPVRVTDKDGKLRDYSVLENPADAAKIVANKIGGLSFLLREANRFKQTGTQGDNVLPLLQNRPRQYKNAAAQKAQEQRIANAKNRRGLTPTLLHLMGLDPQDPEILKFNADYARSLKRDKAKRKAKTSPAASPGGPQLEPPLPSGGVIQSTPQLEPPSNSGISYKKKRPTTKPAVNRRSKKEAELALLRLSQRKKRKRTLV